MRRAEFEARHDSQYAANIDTTLPLWAHDHRAGPGGYIEDVPYQTVNPASIMPPPPPKLEDMDTDEDVDVDEDLEPSSDVDLDSSSDVDSDSSSDMDSDSSSDVGLEPTSNVSITQASTFKKSVPTRKGTSRTGSSIKPKSKPRPQPTLSPRRKVLQKHAKNTAGSNSAYTPPQRKGKARQSYPEEESESETSGVDDYEDSDDGGDDEDDDDDDDEYTLAPIASSDRGASTSTTARSIVIAAKGVCRDLSGIEPWGVPLTAADRMIEHVRALAAKNMHLIKKRDMKKSRGTSSSTKRVRMSIERLSLSFFLTITS